MITGGVVFVPMRVTSGRWSAATVGTTAPRNKLVPMPNHSTIGRSQKDGTVLLDPGWRAYFEFIGVTQLGGPTAPTVGDVVTKAESILAQNTDVSNTSNAIAQQTQANADSLAAAIEVIRSNALTGADQIPPPQTGAYLP